MKTLLIVLLLIFVSASRDTEKKCTIKGLLVPKEKDTTFLGQIIKDESNYMLLFKASKFPIYEAKIPIIENKFTYKFNFKDPEVFELVKEEEFNQGNMIVTSFFCENGQIDLTIYPDNNRIAMIKGYTLNKELNNYYVNLQKLFWNEYQKYDDSINILSKKGTKVFSKEFSELTEKRKKAADEKILKQIDNELNYLQNTGLMYTPAARKFAKIQDSIFNEKKKWEFDNIYKNTTLLSYYLFMNNIKETAKSCCWKEVDAELINNAKNNLDKYVKNFRIIPTDLL